jgi:hypothetical protein
MSPSLLRTGSRRPIASLRDDSARLHASVKDATSLMWLDRISSISCHGPHHLNSDIRIRVATLHCAKTWTRACFTNYDDIKEHCWYSFKQKAITLVRFQG